MPSATIRIAQLTIPIGFTAMRIAPGVAFACAALLLGMSATEASGQDLHPSRRPSPIGIARTRIGDVYVKVTYGRPYMRGRQIFGQSGDSEEFLVPYGQVWRTGANESTEITITGPLTVGGRRLEAGTYSIFTVPNAESWTIHFSPLLGLDGTGIFDPETGTVREVYDPEQDILVVKARSGSTAEEVDQFTIELQNQNDGADMILRWERTVVRVPIRPAS